MITRDTIEHLATLSRLQFSDVELDAYTHDIGDIFNYANMLQQVDTKDIEPSAHAVPLENVYAADKVTPYKNIDELLKNAPEEEGHAFKVPRILVD